MVKWLQLYLFLVCSSRGQSSKRPISVWCCLLWVVLHLLTNPSVPKRHWNWPIAALLMKADSLWLTTITVLPVGHVDWPFLLVTLQFGISFAGWHLWLPTYFRANFFNRKLGFQQSDTFHMSTFYKIFWLFIVKSKSPKQKEIAFFIWKLFCFFDEKSKFSTELPPPSSSLDIPYY